MLRTPTFGNLLLRRWPIALLAIVALGAAGAAFGSTRPQTYTAQAQLIVGPSASSPQALTGTADASVQIAGNYAQLGNTLPIARTAARGLGVSPNALVGAVTVSNVNGNPLVRIQARSENERTAVRYAAGYAQTLRAAIDEQISPERLGRSQLESYSEAARDLLAARRELQQLRDDDAPRDEIADATTAVNTAQLEADTAGDIYAQARQAAQAVTGLTEFDDARPIGDDRTDLLLRWTAVGVGGGVVVGLLLASGLALLRRRVLHRGT